MEKEILFLVDENDKVIGSEEKKKCHLKDGLLHRAIFVLLFNYKNQFLLTQRSKYKPLWPLIWDGACASHPRYPNEDYFDCAKRRIKEELGVLCPLKYLFKLRYQAKYKDVGSENEICAIFIGVCNDKIKINKKEIADYKWIDFKELKREIEKNPEKFSPWLKKTLRKISSSKLLDLIKKLRYEKNGD